MRFDLGGVGIERPDQAFPRNPAQIFPSRNPDRRLDGRCNCPQHHSFSQEWAHWQAFATRAQAMSEVGKFLSNRGRRGGLAMQCGQASARLANSCAIWTSLLMILFQCRQHHPVAAVHQHQPMREIIDVLRSAGKMYELRQLLATSAFFARRSLSQYSTALTSWLVRASISLTASPSISEKFAATLSSCAMVVAKIDCTSPISEHVAQCLKPFYFQLDTITNQRKFAEIRPQVSDFAVVASIQGGKRGKKRRTHIFKVRIPLN